MKGNKSLLKTILSKNELGSILPLALLLIVCSCLLIIPGSITDMVGLGSVLVIGAYCKISSKAGRAASAS